MGHWAAHLIGFLYGFIVDVRVNNNDNTYKHLYNLEITFPMPHCNITFDLCTSHL